MTKGKTVSAKEFAAWHGISQSRVSQLIRDGMPAENEGRRGAKAKINTAAASEWLIERRARQQSGKRESERERLYREQADEKALSNERERGNLIYRDQVRDVLLMIAQSLASALDGLPGRLANELAHQDARPIRERLLNELRLVREDLAFAAADWVVQHGGEDPFAERRTPRNAKRPKKRSSKQKKARASVA